MWKTIIKVLTFPFRLIAIILIKLYQLIISPMLPRTCRFYPTCSNYTLLAIKEWGVIRGVWLGMKRIVRCRPRGDAGEDFVPLNVKGELKWVY